MEVVSYYKRDAGRAKSGRSIQYIPLGNKLKEIKERELIPLVLGKTERQKQGHNGLKVFMNTLKSRCHDNSRTFTGIRVDALEKYTFSCPYIFSKSFFFFKYRDKKMRFTLNNLLLHFPEVFIRCSQQQFIYTVSKKDWQLFFNSMTS